MKPDHEPSGLIDLGAASVETQGPPDLQIELSAFTRVRPGISDED
jgi:hypothetical protein